MRLDVDEKGCCRYGIYMITKIFKSVNSMALRLRRQLNPSEREVSIIETGCGWLVEPVKPRQWQGGFFEQIRIRSKEFSRPPQGVHRSVEL